MGVFAGLFVCVLFVYVCLVCLVRLAHARTQHTSTHLLADDLLELRLQLRVHGVARPQDHKREDGVALHVVGHLRKREGERKRQVRKAQRQVLIGACFSGRTVVHESK